MNSRDEGYGPVKYSHFSCATGSRGFLLFRVFRGDSSPLFTRTEGMIHPTCQSADLRGTKQVLRVALFNMQCEDRR